MTPKYKLDNCPCGRGTKAKTAKRCFLCATEARSNPTHRVETCHCGGMKTKGAPHCFQCRYSNPDVSTAAERITKESLVGAMDMKIAGEWLRKPIRVAA